MHGLSQQVNSKFTAKVFQQTFTKLRQRQPAVLYPSLHFAAFDQVWADLDAGMGGPI